MASRHLTLPNLIKTCEVASLNAPFKNIMASIGASENLCYHWRNLSNAAEAAGDTNSIFYFEWRQGQFGYWATKISQARIDFIQGYEADLRHECRFGREEVVLGPTQEIVYRLDPALIGVSDADLEGLWGRSHRYLLDDDGMPIPLTKTVFPPPAIRLRILEQDKRYLATQQVDVNLRAQVVHIPQPLQRRIGEERPDIAALRALSKIPPTHPYPLDAHGNRTLPQLASPRGDERSDHVREQQPIEPPVNPRMYTAPLNVPNAPKPSYAKPVKSLDQSGRGRGEAPPGGGPANAPGNVR
jgi:hypothetical protein